MIYKFVDCKHSNELLVMFSTFGMSNRFMQFGSLTTNQKFNLLFLADPEYTWYLGDNNIHDILEKYSIEFGYENCYFVGSSMGAYGALLYGLYLNCNVIVSNPQINKEITLKHCNQEGMGKYLIKSNFVNIDNKFQNSKAYIYYLYGKFQMDIDNQKEFSKCQFNNLVFEHIDIDKHTYFLCDVNDLYDRISLLSKMRKLNTSEGVKFD